MKSLENEKEEDYSKLEEICLKRTKIIVQKECAKVINDNKMTINEKTFQIGKILDREFPELGTESQNIIKALLIKFSSEEKIIDFRKYYFSGSGRKLAKELLISAFNDYLYVYEIDFPRFKDHDAYKKKITELETLKKYLPSGKKILIVFKDVDELCKKI